jgi:tetratricopeptide (TPR) repeat protein
MPSRNSNNGLRTHLNRAIRLDQQGDRVAAIAMLEELSHKHPDAAAPPGYLAKIYFNLDDWPNAEKWFRQATQRNPKSELASVGLFHSLWNQGKGIPATQEMQRFLKVADSAEYATLLHDLAVEGQLVPQLEPALS